LGDGLPVDAAFVLSAKGRASTVFCAPSNARFDEGVLGVSRAWAKAALAGGAVVPVLAPSDSVLAAVTFGSAFEPTTTASALSGRRDGPGAAVDEDAGLPGALGDAGSAARTGAPRFDEALAGMIGGGIVARGCAGRGSG
jgi:hypothetical protein